MSKSNEVIIASGTARFIGLLLSILTIFGIILQPWKTMFQKTTEETTAAVERLETALRTLEDRVLVIEQQLK